MVDWLDYYTKQSWVFTAFKFAGNANDVTSTQAIRVSFKTDRPRYPYKMPLDTWPASHARPMNVYFISSAPVVSRYVDTNGNWEAQVRYTGKLDDGTMGAVAKDLILSGSDMPTNATMTVFRNGSNPDGYDHDLYFAVAAPGAAWTWVLGAIIVVIAARMYMRSRTKLYQKAA